MRERNLYQRGGIWWLRASVDGVERRESLRTRDVKTARRIRDARIEAFTAAAFRGEKRVSWKEAVAAWAEHEAVQIAPSTARRYAVSLLQCEPFLELFAVDEIDGKSISALIAGRRKLGATPATVRRDLTAVSRVLEHAEAEGWREGNPTLSKRKLLKERRDPIVLPERAAIEAVIDAATPRFGALIRAAELTGARQDELVRATWRAFNPRAATLEIIGKGRKRRTIRLDEAAAAHFSAQPRTLGAEQRIFCREGGLPFAQAASDFTHLRRQVEAQAEREGQPFRRFRFHDLRHLYAVEALRRGVGIYDLSKHLGHTSVKTTEIYLAFLTSDEAERAKASTAQIPAQSRRFAG